MNKIKNMDRAFVIWIIGSAQETVEWLRSVLTENRLLAEIHRVKTTRDLLGRLQQQKPDVVLTDNLSERDVLQTLTSLSSQQIDAPVIAMVSQLDEEVEARLIAAHIRDIVLKTRPIRLVSILQNCLKHIEYLHDLHAAKRALEKSEFRFRAIASNLPGLVFQFVLESDGGIFFPYVSDGAQALLGLFASELQAKPEIFSGMILEEDIAGYQQSMRISGEHFAAWNWEGRIQTRGDNDIKWISLRATPRRTPRDAVLWDGIMLNITRNKQIELEIARSRAQLEALSVYSQKAKENERARIAREIHDDIGGTLTAIKCELVPCLDGSDRSVGFYRNKVEAMESLIDMVIDSTRRIALDLRPGILDCGIVAAVQWQAREFSQRTGITCAVECTAEEDISLDADLAVAIFRIFQETLTNIAKHAEASAVRVKLTEADEQVILKVVDNGRGITWLELEKVDSFGIQGMRERCLQLGGRFHISGEPQTGTEVIVRIPISNQPMFIANGTR